MRVVTVIITDLTPVNGCCVLAKPSTGKLTGAVNWFDLHPTMIRLNALTDNVRNQSAGKSLHT